MYVCVRPRISSLLKLGWLSADFSRRADDAVPTALRWWMLPRWMSCWSILLVYFDKNRIATSCWVHEERWRRWMFPCDDCACESRWRNIDDVGRSYQEETYKKYLDLFFDLFCVEMADVFSFFYSSSVVSCFLWFLFLFLWRWFLDLKIFLGFSCFFFSLRLIVRWYTF